MKSFGYLIIKKLMIKYHETHKKRYFPNSQLHFKKLCILQYFNIACAYINDFEYSVRDELMDLLLNALSEEAHQSSTKILLQWSLSNLMYGISENFSSFDDEITTLINYIRRLKGQNVGNLFPVIYHLSKKCNKTILPEVMNILLEHSMGPCFNLRYIAQVD